MKVPPGPFPYQCFAIRCRDDGRIKAEAATGTVAGDVNLRPICRGSGTNSIRGSAVVQSPASPGVILWYVRCSRRTQRHALLVGALRSAPALQGAFPSRRSSRALFQRVCRPRRAQPSRRLRWRPACRRGSPRSRFRRGMNRNVMRSWWLSIRSAHLHTSSAARRAPRYSSASRARLLARSLRNCGYRSTRNRSRSVGMNCCRSLSSVILYRVR